MGEDVFWSIRGGGGASFGIIIAWKIKLVRVPPIATVFTVHKNLDQQGIQLVNIWQNVASKLPRDLFIRLIFQNSNRGEVEVMFDSLYLGPAEELIPLMEKRFPELGLDPVDCSEMSWIESTLYFDRFKPGDPLEVLLERNVQAGIKATSRENQILRENQWETTYSEAESRRHINWIRELYDYMEPYVSSSPRSTYLNYRDLDIGINELENITYSQATIWGTKYFKGNFKKLAEVKSRVDPRNIFRSEQSIPPLYNQGIQNRLPFEM
ncbi:berberine bridge enzyme-like 22 [Primulina eburnea]|uniref:berberine bridge enzyme-like 22 n=1 Tax=Primulina eburnea TaxID=1245227 RepID=UPI003C6C199D